MRGCNAYNYFAPHVSLHEVKEENLKGGMFPYKGLLVRQRLRHRDGVSSEIGYRLVTQLDLDLAKDPLRLSSSPSCILTCARETLTDRMAKRTSKELATTA